MATEYEVKVLDIDTEGIISRLNNLGAEKIGEKNMRRYVYEFSPKRASSWIRLRDEGEKVSITIKEFVKDSIDGMEETEIVVDDFETANLLLEKLGYSYEVYQENKRISYLLDGVRIEIDSWPKIPEYLEIEGDSREDVERIIDLLEIDKTKITSVPTKDIYEKYGLNLHSFKELRFG